LAATGLVASELVAALEQLLAMITRSVQLLGAVAAGIISLALRPRQVGRLFAGPLGPAAMLTTMETDASRAAPSSV